MQNEINAFFLVFLYGLVVVRLVASGTEFSVLLNMSYKNFT
jgi:hypothetical protein